MEPDRAGYVSLDEEDTSGSSHHSTIPTGPVQWSPTSVAEDMEFSDDSADEMAEAGEPEEPCFMSNGVAKNNRGQWLGWKPSVTPFTPPPKNRTPRAQADG